MVPMDVWVCMSGLWIQPPMNFEVTIGEKVNRDQKVNIGRISKILNFNPINLKFEELLYITMPGVGLMVRVVAWDPRILS